MHTSHMRYIRAPRSKRSAGSNTHSNSNPSPRKQALPVSGGSGPEEGRETDAIWRSTLVVHSGGQLDASTPADRSGGQRLLDSDLDENWPFRHGAMRVSPMFWSRSLWGHAGSEPNGLAVNSGDQPCGGQLRQSTLRRRKFCSSGRPAAT